jgi:hypothetical protein
MVRKTTPGRATLLNKETKSKKINEKKIKDFLKEFLKTSDKQKIFSPPTDFEKALIIEETGPIRIKTPKKIILPKFVADTNNETCPIKKKTTRKK